MQRRTCLFSGRVQGVGFRCTAHMIAMQHDVTGTVRNLPDGRVKIVIEGPSQEIDAVIDDLHQRLNGFIERVDQTIEPPTGEFQQFQIKQ